MAAVEHTAALVIEGEPARSRIDVEIPIADIRQKAGHLVPEVIVSEIEKFGLPGAARTRTCVDRDPKPLAAAFEQDVIVRSCAPALRLPVDDSAAEETVVPDRHPTRPRPERRPPRNRFCAVVILPYLPG